MPGGLSYTDTTDLFMALGQHGRVVGFNLAKHYPGLDVNGITAITITRLIMATMAGSKLDAVPPKPFQQPI
jgi:arginase family enzyme